MNKDVSIRGKYSALVDDPNNKLETVDYSEYKTFSSGALINDFGKVIGIPFDPLDDGMTKKLYLGGKNKTNLTADIRPYMDKEINKKLKKSNISIDDLNIEDRKEIADIASKNINSLSPKAYKLFLISNSVFVNENSSIKTNLSVDENRYFNKYFNQVKMNEIEYYKACGYPYKGSSVRNTRRNVVKALEELLNITASWKEKVRGSDEAYSGLNLISYYSVEDNIITIEYPNKLASYFLTVPQQTLNMKLFSIDERNPIALKLGAKLLNYASINKNIKTGQYQHISTKKIIEFLEGSILTIEECRKKRQSWRKIFNPIVKGLEELVNVGVIEDYYFYIDKNKRLDGHLIDDERLDDFNNNDFSDYLERLDNKKIKSYDVFERTFLYFELENDPHQKRMAKVIKKDKEKNNKRKTTKKNIL